MITALIALGVGLLLTVVLPILSWLRATEARAAAQRHERRLSDIELTLRLLEERLRTGAVTAPSQKPSPADPAAPVDDTEAPTVPPLGGLENPAEAGPHILQNPPIPPPGLPTPARPLPLPLPDRGDEASALESRIGARWMLYLGVGTLVVGIGLFIRHAFQNDWITETMQVVIGGLAGVGLIVAGARFIAGGYALYGQMLSGGGLAALYLSTYAAFNLYQLIDRLPAFVLLTVITGSAAGLADRHRSQGLALMAVVGGFMTPFMVSSGADAQVALFTYVAILIAGTLYLARRRGWPALHLVSLTLTVVTVWAWANRFYDPSKYLVTELFLTLYGVLFLVIQHEARRLTHGLAATVTRALWAAPILYHLASLVILAPQPLPFLIYLIAFSFAGLMFGARAAPAWVRLLLWAVVAMPLYGWLVDHTSQTWFWPGLTALAAVSGMHIAAQVEAFLRERNVIHPADVVLAPANAIWLYGGLYALLEPRFFPFAGVTAALVAIGYASLGAALRRFEHPAALHLRVVAFTLAGLAVAVQFDGPWVTVLWAAEAAGLLWVGLEERRDWVRLGGALLMGTALYQLLDLLLSPVPSGYRVLFNERIGVSLFLAGMLSLAAWCHRRRQHQLGGRGAREIATAIVAANVLVILALTTEIDAFWLLRGARSGLPRVAELARQVTISVFWATYAALLIAAGFERRYAPVRYLALALFGVTVVKVFTVDLSQLDSIYRILSSVGLGALLVGASFLYHRYRGQLTPSESGPPLA